MTQSRWAGPSILGYVYQFEYTVLRLLRAAENDHIVVEGVEDVDLITAEVHHAIQVKYHGSTRYSSSRSIRKPIEQMWAEFRPGSGLTYTIYAHFDTGDVPASLTVDELKHALSGTAAGVPWQHWSNNDDAKLDAFASALTIVSGPTRDEQYQSVIAELSDAFSVDRGIAENLYYPASLTFIAELSVKSAKNERSTSRSEFKGILDRSFAVWSNYHARAVDRRKWLKELAKELRDRRALDTKSQRVLFVGDEVSLGDAAEAVDVLRMLGERSFVTRVEGSKPWTIAFQNGEFMKAVLRGLTGVDVPFNSGYADYGLSPTLFHAAPFVELKGSKIKSASYVLRIVEYNRIDGNRLSINPTSLISWGPFDATAPSMLSPSRILTAVGILRAAELIRFLEESQS